MRIEEMIRQLFCRVFCRGCLEPHPEPPPQPRWRIGKVPFSIHFTGNFDMNLKDNAAPQSVSVDWVDSRGKKAPVEAGSLTIVSSDENLVKVVDDGAGNFTVEPGALDGVDADVNGVIGTATVTATADADLGDGKTDVAAVGAVVVVAGDAVLGNLSIGGQPA